MSVEFQLGHQDHLSVEDFLACGHDGVGAISLHPKAAAHQQGAAGLDVHSKWSDIRPQAVAELGGEQVVAVARQRQQAYIDAYRLAERRTALGLTQVDVAERMGVTKGRVSQIERGEVSTVDVIARYVQAIGGELQISAVFGDDHYVLRGTDTDA